MIDKRLMKELGKIEVPLYDIRKYEETIMKAKAVKLHPEKQRMCNKEFFINQLRFIKKKTWFLKFIISIMILYVISTEQIDISGWTWTLIAVSGPALCLINANEICNIFQPGMVEIQMTAKNSFGKVLMVRLITFGLFDFIFFVCMALGMSIFKKTIIWQVILYGLVPYIIMCFGCLMILNRCREENVSLYSLTWGVCLNCIIIISKISDIRIYQASYFNMWLGIGLIALGGTIIELHRLFKKTGGNLDEISYGTSV